MYPVWAPNGAHFATSNDAGAVVYDADGKSVAQSRLYVFDWFDDMHLIGLHVQTGAAEIFDITDQQSRVIDLPHTADWVSSNGDGVAAFSWARDNDWPDTHYNYFVWHDDAVTQAHDGYGQAWSDDGSKLALYHQFKDVREPNGWLSVVSWPDLKPLYVGGPPVAADDVAFDPSSSYIAFNTDTGDTPCSGTRPESAKPSDRIVDLDTGTMVDIPTDNTGCFYWTTDSEFAVLQADGSLLTYQPDGTLVSTAQDSFTACVESGDDSTDAFWSFGDSSLRVVHDGHNSDYQAPDDPWHVYLSTDGSQIVVEANYQTYFQRL